MSDSTQAQNSDPKMQESYRNFIRGISSDSTKKNYELAFKQFTEFHKITDYEKLAQSTAKEIDRYIVDFLDHMEARGNKCSSIRTNLAGIERFFLMNDCIWHKERIHHQIKKDTQIPGGSKPITTKEIAHMLKFTTSHRTIAFIHFLASTGIRTGAIVDPVLSMRHLQKIGNGCTAVTIYDESKEGYWAFLTPEATNALEDYFEHRRTMGETLGPDSPVFSNKLEKSKNNYFGAESARVTISNLAKKAGIKRIKKGERYDKAVIYMFRKRFNTIMKLEGAVNSNIAEKLMGHKRGLDGAYLQPTMEEMFAEFEKGISELTIDQTTNRTEKPQSHFTQNSEYTMAELIEIVKSLSKDMGDLKQTVHYMQMGTIRPPIVN